MKATLIDLDTESSACTCGHRSAEHMATGECWECGCEDFVSRARQAYLDGLGVRP